MQGSYAGEFVGVAAVFEELTKAEPSWVAWLMVLCATG